MSIVSRDPAELRESKLSFKITDFIPVIGLFGHHNRVDENSDVIRAYHDGIYTAKIIGRFFLLTVYNLAPWVYASCNVIESIVDKT